MGGVRGSEVGRGPLRFAFAHAGRSLKAFGCIANLYSQAGAVAGAARSREAENRIRQEPWGGVMRRSGRTFKPLVQGSNPCTGTNDFFGERFHAGAGTRVGPLRVKHVGAGTRAYPLLNLPLRRPSSSAPQGSFAAAAGSSAVARASEAASRSSHEEWSG